MVIITNLRCASSSIGIKTIPTLGPHFGLFLAIFYGFAGMGISFFCGLCKQHTREGGPGYSGQTGPGYPANPVPANYTMGKSPAFGIPWSQTAYGGTPYYYNFNYDGFAHAIASLYVVMIQNNWSVAADGPVQVTNGNMRWFFVVFTIMVAFVMMNVLIGAIIDALNGVREEIIREENGDHDPLEILCQARINATKAPSGNFYGEIWELGDVELYGEVRYDAELCQLFAEEQEEETKAVTAELERRKVALEAELGRLKAQHGFAR